MAGRAPSAAVRWNARYLIQKLEASAAEAAAALRAPSPSAAVPAGGALAEAIHAGLRAFRGQLTAAITLTGAAMAPTLNAAAAADPGGGHAERLLLRLLPRPAPRRSLFDGDVVAFRSPIAGPVLDGAEPPLMVRRVAALEGDEMASDDPEDAEFLVPRGHVWVLADNETAAPADAPDSRTFGPLALEAVVGRVMYAAGAGGGGVGAGASGAAHGAVENSEEAMAADAAVLEAELDIEALAAGR
jgi:hypothetical protein